MRRALRPIQGKSASAAVAATKLRRFKLYESFTFIMTAREAAVDALARSQKDTEQLHAEHQAALAALSAEYQTERSHRESELAEERRRVEELNQNISASEQRNGELENVLGQHRRDLEAATADAATLRSRLDDLESRHTELAAATREQEQLRVQFEAELSTARGELQQNASVAAQHQAAIAELRNEYQIKQNNQDNELVQERQRVTELTLQIGEFEQQKTAIETQLKERLREHETVAIEAAALRSRLDELETRRQMELSAAEREQNQVRSHLETELAAARGELEQKAWASAQQQAALENLALAHQSQIQKLESQMSEERNQIRERDHGKTFRVASDRRPSRLCRL